MLSLQEAIGLDMDVMGSGFGFTPWGPDTCPTLEQLMAAPSSSSPSSSVCMTPEEQEEEDRRRRQRRKVSNRLSAQRSRARKQQRLEELRGTAARLRAENGELAAKLHAVARQELAARCLNARLRADTAALARRYCELRRLLALQRLTQQLRARRSLQPGVGGDLGGQGRAAAFAPGAAPGLASLMT